eukprot:g5500.t1
MQDHSPPQNGSTGTVMWTGRENMKCQNRFTGSRYQIFRLLQIVKRSLSFLTTFRSQSHSLKGERESRVLCF